MSENGNVKCSNESNMWVTSLKDTSIIVTKLLHASLLNDIDSFNSEKYESHFQVFVGVWRMGWGRYSDVSKFSKHSLLDIFKI